jgi:hypothetical protein
MPGPATILEGLRAIAHDGVAVAVVWHVLLAAAAVALLFGWRPSRQLAGALLAAPVASVSAFAFGYANLFNGIVFGAIALALFEVGTRLPAQPVQRGGATTAAVGVCMIAFAWIYPHFLDMRSSAIYLVGAPVGLIPCPTLALVVGFTLLGDGFGSRAWALVVAAAGLFYGVFGVARLGVGLDLVLAAGSLCLIGLSWSRRPAPKTIASHA